MSAKSVLGRVAAGCLLLALAGCGSHDDGGSFKVGDEGAVKGFIGGVSSEEPQAALIGRDLLSAGGSAADAAAGMYFALSVTYPSAASLGGGGACVVYDTAKNKAELLEFPAGTPRRPGPVAIPANVRGFAALQARYGRLRWERILSPAEQLARFGYPLSRATAQAVAALGPKEQGRVPAFLLNGQGQPLAEGSLVRQLSLGATLARLRTGGINDFYAGASAQQLLQDQTAAGGTLDSDDLRRTVARWAVPSSIAYGNVTLLMPPAPAGGDIFQRLWQPAVQSAGLIGSGKYDRAKFVQASATAYGALGGGMPVGGSGSTGFAAMDSYGQAVACAVTMQQPFGTGRLAAQSGILLAAAPGGPQDESRFLIPVVGANTQSKTAFLAASASGGAAAPAALVQVLASAMAEGKDAEAAEAAPRVFRAGNTAVLLHEPGLTAEQTQSYAGQGLTLAEVSSGLGRVALLYCRNGVPREPKSCRFQTDPRGFGLAIGAAF